MSVRWAGLAIVFLTTSACNSAPHLSRSAAASQPRLKKTQRLIVEGARNQLSWGTRYDPSYQKISYPNGDVDRKKGVCTDVVIRSLRNAGYDLQQLIHKDISSHWGVYHRYAHNPRPDSNIDQRRVPNQRVFFRRFGVSLAMGTNDPKNWSPGDIVEWRLSSGLDHTGVLTDRLDPEWFPLVIHNIGAGAQEEDVLRSWKITGHFRLPKS